MALAAGGAAIATMVQTDERLLEADRLEFDYQRREASLETSLEVAMAEAERLAAQLTQVNAALAHERQEKALLIGYLKKLEQARQQLIGELYETAAAETALLAQSAQFGVSFQTRSAEAQARIVELESALKTKTEMATQMLSELEASATSTFNAFTAKVASQDKIIGELHQQIERLQQTNDALINQRSKQQFEPAYQENFVGDRLLNLLARN